MESGLTFSGVRFALVGFNPIDENTLRSKLLSGGGVDVGQYTQNSTHLIVDKLVYDDPVCVSARSNGKVVVTPSWVDHSFDVGMLIDANSVLYRPLRDLNGIPGSKTLVVCLTGYQRQDREDIMTMVDLMGGQFSKPLVANKVTHLICYKFEGEKYELAKRMKRIKLVNHRWLEDCLKNWKLLPEVDYEISGYELEMMEASARDSEDEADDASVKRANTSPLGLRVGAMAVAKLSKSGGKDIALAQTNLGEPDGSLLCSTSKENRLTPKKLEAIVSTDAVAAQQHNCERASTFQNNSNYASPVPVNKTSERGIGRVETDDSACINMSIRRQSSLATYSRKTVPKSPETSTLGNESGGQNGTVRMDDKGLQASTTVNISASKSSSSVERTTLFEDFDKIDKLHGEESSPLLPQPKLTDGSFSSKGSQKVHHSSEASIPPPASLLLPKETAGPALSINDPVERMDVGHKSPAIPMEETILTAENMVVPNISEHTEGREVAHNMDVSGLPGRLFNSSGVLMEADIRTAENITVKGGLDEVPERSVIEPVMMRSSTSPGSSLVGLKNEVETELSKKKTASRKSLGTRGKKKNPVNQKGSIYLSEPTPKDKHTDGLIKGEVSAPATDSGNQKEISSPVLNAEAVPEIEKCIDSETEALRTTEDKLQAKTTEEADAEVNDGKCRKEASVEKDRLQSGKKRSCTVESEKPNVKKKKNSKKEADAEAKDTVRNDIGGNSAEVKENVAVDKKPENVSSDRALSPVGRRKQAARKEIAAKIPSKAAMQLEVDKNKRKNRKDATVESSSNLSGKKRSSAAVEVEKSIAKKPTKSKKEREAKATDIVMKDIGDNSAEEKEITAVDNVSGGDKRPVSGKSAKTGKKADKESKQLSAKPLASRKVLQKQKEEPKCFIVSGPKPHRKEYQQIIKFLKGKCCRDSHQWSYQATHFIAPEIRRTEKFFAAAASGSWILKTDYVVDSKEAGKLLPEEPYEWHGTGLSTDGAISLKSPRKWRLVREQTGHGALHGLRVVVYGDCTIPSLDTLKRAVKAGDGMILATAPPYTRFLNQSTDFAVISPGMPRDDVWIQEFIRFEIPCVLADYIVEYVCKPGYTLDKHVLYNTNTWAERSFNKLKLSVEEATRE